MTDIKVIEEKAEKILDEFCGTGKEELIKSKSRVAETGEVFTPRWCVRDMLNLEGVKECSYDIDTTFLEPACGNGNFLIQILARKLCCVDKNSDRFDIDVARCVASTYGVDIAPDNIREARDRMIKVIDLYCKSGVIKRDLSDDAIKSISYIMYRNIICGNTITNDKIKEFINEPRLRDDYPELTRKELIQKKNEIKRLMDERYGDGELRFSEWKFDGDEVTRIECRASDIESINAEIYDGIKFNELYKQIDKE